MKSCKEIIWGMFFLLLAINAYGESASAQKEKLEKLICTFTEPFLIFTFDPQLGLATLTGPGFDNDDTAETTKILSVNAKLIDHRNRINGPRNLVIVNGDNADDVLLSIDPDKQGSDGMSDLVYPFQGEFNGLIGGCQTTAAPALDIEVIIRDLMPLASPVERQ